MSTNPSNESNAAAVIEAMERLTDSTDISEAELSSGALVVVPEGRTIHDLRPFQDARLTKPRRIDGTAAHTTLDSFIDHAIRFKGAESAIYADDTPKRPRLTAVFDYHEGHDAPQFGKHRSVYNFPVSEEWATWLALQERNFISQTDFAVFLEDHVGDVLIPTEAHAETHAKAKLAGIELGGPSTLMQLARNLTVLVSAEATQVQTLATGEAHLIYREQHQTLSDGGKQVKVPSGIVLSIPVFRGGLREDVLVRFRYRTKDGKVAFAVVLHGVEALFRNAFVESTERAKDKTGLPVFFGSPE